MSNEKPAQLDDAEHVRLTLAQGLKACRAMVANYRVMLSGAANDNPSEEPSAEQLYMLAEPRKTDEI